MKHRIAVLLLFVFSLLFSTPLTAFERGEDDVYPGAWFRRWHPYRMNFGVEKVNIRLPQKPTVTQSTTLMSAYAYENGILYCFSGYYPAISNIDADEWFNAILKNMRKYPYDCLSYEISTDEDTGDHYIDYVAQDTAQNVIIKARARVTRFNAYTLQCVKPNGAKDYFDYFIDNFVIQTQKDIKKT